MVAFTDIACEDCGKSVRLPQRFVERDGPSRVWCPDCTEYEWTEKTDDNTSIP